MVWDWLHTLLFLVAGFLAYRYGPRVAAAVKRFDRDNSRRIERERSDRTDHTAHFRHTIDAADEQVEEIAEIRATDMRTGTPVTLFLFEGETFSSRDEAELVRARQVYLKAKAFYAELPVALSERRRGNLGRE
jgi:hypothetical protein